MVFDHKTLISGLSSSPGIYCMIGTQGQIIYIGKAKNLKNRVASYFSGGQQGSKVASMVSNIATIETTLTNTEAEALILENQLIKAHKPKYNILLRDDKSYPYIHLSHHRYPRLAFHRGAKRGKGKYYGPYPSSGAVRESLHWLQKTFRVRPCSDTFFHNRTRPCLQHQIKRCSAPCIDQISTEDYAKDITSIHRFLSGQSASLIDDLILQMEQHATALEYEQAAEIRDKINNLRKVQEKQYVNVNRADTDIIACVTRARVAAVQLTVIRNGAHLGSKTFFPSMPYQATESEIISAFINQYYNRHPCVPTLLTNIEPDDKSVTQTVLSEKLGRKVSIQLPSRGEGVKLTQMAEKNAQHALNNRLASQGETNRRFDRLAEIFQLDDVPQRLECFDISHTMGEETVASCVVFNRDGPSKSDYRRFNIKNITKGDDYQATKQVVERRYSRLLEESGILPDIIFIDGGKGQLRYAQEALNELQLDAIPLVAIAKGVSRKPGLEQILLPNATSALAISETDPALHLIQQIRDEAHRFAITGHRNKRQKKQQKSTLETISGLGPKRRQTLLKQFGGLQGIKRAGVDELSKIPGISSQLALRIYDHFRE